MQNSGRCRYLKNRGGILEDTFWSPWPWPRRSSHWPWPRGLKSSKIGLSSARGQHYILSCWNFVKRLKIFFGKRFFVEIAWKIFVKTFFFIIGDCLKNFCEDLFFLGEHLRLCPWPRAFLSLASRVSVLGLGFFWCPWPWPPALCPRLHLC